MKKSIWIIIILITVAVVAILLLRRQPSAIGPETSETDEQEAVVAEPAPPPIAPSPAEVRAILAAPPPASPAPTAAEATPGPTAEEEVSQEVEVLPDAVLATVNDIPITLENLIPVRAQDKGRPVKMEASDYYARLESAINTEVVMQEAVAQGVTLSDEQQSVVTSLRARAIGDIAAHRAEGHMWTSVTEEQMAHTERHVTALLLQKNLLEKQGIPTSPVLTEDQIRQYYETNKADFGELPSDPAQRQAAWDVVRGQIVDLIWPYLLKKYEEENQKYMESLKGGANITYGANTSG